MTEGGRADREDVLCHYWHGASRPEDTAVPQGRSPRPEGGRADDAVK